MGITQPIKTLYTRHGNAIIEKNFDAQATTYTVSVCMGITQPIKHLYTRHEKDTLVIFGQLSDCQKYDQSQYLS
jgi:hypothetical protein